jgi:uncharacterized DUF497 family protein
MEFEWDAEKSARNLAERGFDFAFVTRLFEGRTLEAIDRRRDYRETRMIAIGAIDGGIYCVVYTDRDEVRRIISARLASRKERAAWQSSA